MLFPPCLLNQPSLASVLGRGRGGDWIAWRGRFVHVRILSDATSRPNIPNIEIYRHKKNLPTFFGILTRGCAATAETFDFRLLVNHFILDVTILLPHCRRLPRDRRRHWCRRSTRRARQRAGPRPAPGAFRRGRADACRVVTGRVSGAEGHYWDAWAG